MRFGFLADAIPPEQARAELAQAIGLLVERPALEAALAAATRRFESDLSEGAYAEQQRLLKRKLEFDARLRQMASARAGGAVFPCQTNGGLMDEDDNIGGGNEGGDAPLIDLNEASIKKLIARAKRRGVITVDELNEALPQDQMTSEQIEDIMAAISEMGVNIVESDEDAVDPDEKEVEEIDEQPDGMAERPDLIKRKETVERTDDPVRMYLREMGAVELLSREGEIAIAKRIEAGRDTMILGLCESPITFHAIIQWSEALNNEEMQLREILDLDAMLSKEPAPENLSEDGEDEGDGEISEATAGPSYKEEEDIEEEELVDEDDEDGIERRARRPVEEEEEDNTLSLAQMEAQLKPHALEKFAEITSLFKKFEKLQAERLDVMGAGGVFSAAKEKTYQQLREDLTAQVESVQFHATKIEYLVDNLYAFNRRLTALGGQMLRLANATRSTARTSSTAMSGASWTMAGSRRWPPRTRSGPPSPKARLTRLSESAPRSPTSLRPPA